MGSSQDTQTRTRVFARVIGPFYAIVAVIGAVHAPKTRTVLSDLGVWPWATGAFLLMGGLFIIALHQHWGSVAAVIVSLLGWLMALRGFFALAFPSVFMSLANSVADSVLGPSALWRTFYICVAVIGLYLTYVGWAPVPSGPASQAASPTQDLPHPA